MKAPRVQSSTAEMSQADFVLQLDRPDGRAGALHLELQTQADAAKGERMLDYAARLWRREHLPVRPVLILTTDRREQIRARLGPS